MTYTYTEAQRTIDTLWTLLQLAQDLQDRQEPERPESARLPDDSGPRTITRHLFDAGLLRAGAWRWKKGDRWQPYSSTQHLRAAVEMLTDRDITLRDAERIDGFLDIIDHEAGEIYAELFFTALQESGLSWADSDQWARQMTARRLPR